MTAPKRRFLACVLAPAAALVAVWLMLAATASAAPPVAPPAAPAVLVGPLTAITAPAAPAAVGIDLRKTAGTNQASCASGDILLAPAGGTVVYCYVTYNTGTVTVTHHSAIDSQLGVILDDKVFTLTPGSGVFFTAATTINFSVTNVATWTAFNVTSLLANTDVVTDTDIATVTVISSVHFLPAIFR